MRTESNSTYKVLGTESGPSQGLLNEFFTLALLLPRLVLIQEAVEVGAQEHAFPSSPGTHQPPQEVMREDTTGTLL